MLAAGVAGFFARLRGMALRGLRVAGAHLVLAFIVRLGGVAMALGGILVMVGGLVVMFGGGMICHYELSFFGGRGMRHSGNSKEAGSVPLAGEIKAVSSYAMALLLLADGALASDGNRGFRCARALNVSGARVLADCKNRRGGACDQVWHGRSGGEPAVRRHGGGRAAGCVVVRQGQAGARRRCRCGQKYLQRRVLGLSRKRSHRI